MYVVGRDLHSGEADDHPGGVFRVEFDPGGIPALYQGCHPAAHYEMRDEPRELLVEVFGLRGDHLGVRPEFPEGATDHLTVHGRFVRYQDTHNFWFALMPMLLLRIKSSSLAGASVTPTASRQVRRWRKTLLPSV